MGGALTGALGMDSYSELVNQSPSMQTILAQQNAAQNQMNQMNQMNQNQYHGGPFYSPSLDAWLNSNGSITIPPIPKVSKKFDGLMPSKMEKKNMITEVADDLKSFIRSNKSTIYWVAMLLIIDHFFFKGAFKERLHKTVNGFVEKIESKVGETKI